MGGWDHMCVNPVSPPSRDRFCSGFGRARGLTLKHFEEIN